VIDDGVEIRLEAANPLRIRNLAAQHVQEVRRVPKIPARRNRFGAAAEAPVRRDDGWKSGEDGGGRFRRHRDRAGGDSKRVHRIDRVTRTLAQQRDGGGRERALGGEFFTERVELTPVRQIAVPQQPRRLLERRALGELADVKARDDQLAAFAIHVTESRARGDDAFETAVHHRFERSAGVSSCQH
jgi:hypothetical protein